jgi:hypothetical protein
MNAALDLICEKANAGLLTTEECNDALQAIRQGKEWNEPPDTVTNIDKFDSLFEFEQYFSRSCGDPADLAAVWDNRIGLKKRGWYEKALISAYSAIKVNNHLWDASVLGCLFRFADRAKLIAAGDPLPTDAKTFTVYRGVAGAGNHRRVRSYSWTLNRSAACWFALRLLLPKPAIYQATIRRDDVFVYLAREEEIICLPRFQRNIRLPLAELAKDAGKYQRQIEQHNAAVINSLGRRDIP